MSKRPEYLKVKKIIRELGSWQYPGYPFSFYGCIDFKTKDCYFYLKNEFKIKDDWSNFKEKFDSTLLYHILGSYRAQKGSWINPTIMPQYKTFIEAINNPHIKYDEEYYIDNYECATLYFSVYSAIREFKNTNKILFFEYDGDAECVCIEVFSNMDEINTYYKNYIKGE